MGGERWKLDGPHREAPHARWLPRSARRAFCTQLVGWAGLTDIVQAQPSKVPRLGILWPPTARRAKARCTRRSTPACASAAGSEACSIVIDQRFAEVKPELFRSLAAELVR